MDIGAIRWLQECSPHSAVRPKGWGKQRATGYGLNILQTEKKTGKRARARIYAAPLRVEKAELSGLNGRGGVTAIRVRGLRDPD
jgi:hypothetical protein